MDDLTRSLVVFQSRLRPSEAQDRTFREETDKEMRNSRTEASDRLSWRDRKVTSRMEVLEKQLQINPGTVLFGVAKYHWTTRRSDEDIRSKPKPEGAQRAAPNESFDVVSAGCDRRNAA